MADLRDVAAARFLGDAARCSTGSSLDGGQDVTGDGVMDLLVGSPGGGRRHDPYGHCVGDPRDVAAASRRASDEIDSALPRQFAGCRFENSQDVECRGYR